MRNYDTHSATRKMSSHYAECVRSKLRRDICHIMQRNKKPTKC